MEWIILENEKVIQNRVLSEFDWSHSFIREISVVSPSYILPDVSIVAPDCLPSIRIFISSQSVDISGLELLFVEVEEFSTWFAGDLQPQITMSNGEIQWKFNDSSLVKCKYLYCRFLDSKTWGKELRYSWEDIFDSKGEISIL